MVIMESIRDDVKEIKAAYPESRVVSWGNGSVGDPTIVFIKEQPVSGQFDGVKYYAKMMAACFLYADIYKRQDYQYSLGTSSGFWQERLQELEGTIQKVAEGGLEAISNELATEDLAKLDEPVEQC